MGRAVTDLSPEQRAAFEEIERRTRWDPLPFRVTAEQVPAMYREATLALYGREGRPEPGDIFVHFGQRFATHDGKSWFEIEAVPPPRPSRLSWLLGLLGRLRLRVGRKRRSGAGSGQDRAQSSTGRQETR